MLKKILLIQFRVNEKVASHERECILGKIKEREEVEVVNIFKEDFSSSFSSFDKIILGGSGEFSLSEKEEKKDLWEKVKNISNIIEVKVPVLGICFGHQLIAHLLGSEVIPEISQKEVGTFKVVLTKEGKKSKIFKDLPEEFLVQEGHKDSVKELPRKAELLAIGEKCKIQAFSYNNFYGVQFHPEMNSEDVKLRLSFFPDYSTGDSQINLNSSPFASKIIHNFIYD